MTETLAFALGLYLGPGLFFNAMNIAHGIGYDGPINFVVSLLFWPICIITGVEERDL